MIYYAYKRPIISMFIVHRIGCAYQNISKGTRDFCFMSVNRFEMKIHYVKIVLIQTQ